MDYIFYTSQGYTIAPDNSDVENLQILGIESGNTYETAYRNLITNNVWIIEKEYDLTQIECKALAPV